MPGGGGGGTQTSTQQVNTNMGPWQPQQQYLGEVFQSAKDQFDHTSEQGYYPGKTVAGFTPAQSQGYQNIIDRGLAGSPLMPAANKTALDTINGSYLDPATNPWIKKTFDAAAADVTRSYQNTTAPQTDAAFAAAGRYGSGAYARMRGNNEQALGTTLENLGTGIYGENYARERQNQINQTNNVGNLIQASYLDDTAAINAGGAVQGQNQKEIDAEVARYNYERDKYWQNLARYKALVDGSYGQSGTTTTVATQPTPQGNTAGMALGGILGAGSVAGQLGWSPFGAAGAAGAAGGASSLGGTLAAASPLLAGSDRRIKRDVNLIGKTFDGQNLYSFRYIGDDKPYVGLMAQEVEKRDPAAVVEIEGVKFVDYGRALANSVAIGLESDHEASPDPVGVDADRVREAAGAFLGRQRGNPGSRHELAASAVGGL